MSLALLPAEPDLTDALPAQPSPERLKALALRRSSSAQALGLPGPSPEEQTAILRIGARVPDHGKLFPWRFVVIDHAAKTALVEQLKIIAAGRPDADTATAKLAKLAAPPFTVVVVSQPNRDHKIPAWEQELSAGAVCMNLLHAADALGYGASWITDWYAYDAQAMKLLGLAEREKIAGFVHVGAQAAAPLERPRPDLADVVSHWGG